MSTCYKCGKETLNGVAECERCEQRAHPTHETPHMPDLIYGQEIKLDWSKIETFEDFRYVMSVIWPNVTVLEGSPAWFAMRKFLKE